EAMRNRYDKVAPKLEREPASIPKRPSAHAMVELARSDERRDSLRAEVLDAHPKAIVTLGQEAIDGLAAVADAQAGVPSRLTPDSEYGLDARVTIDGDDFLVIPLVHPGLLRQAAAGARWSVSHTRWEDRERRAASRWG
ncbi:MAG: hypothetical protein ACRDZZ_05690, partial [Ilumatobacteraceae bacterium]